MKFLKTTPFSVFASVFISNVFAHAGHLYANPPSSRKARFYNTSFTESWSRYPTPDTILNNLRIQFSFANTSSISSHCKILTDDNRPQLGDSIPSTGAPAIDNPNSTFVNWYLKCLAEYVIAEDRGLIYMEYVKREDGSFQAKTSVRSLQDFQLFFSPEIIEDCKRNDPSNSLTDPSVHLSLINFSCNWSSVSEENKDKFVRQLIRKYIGPEDVLIDLQISESESTFSKIILDELNSYILKPDHRYDFLQIYSGMGSYLSLRDCTKILKFIINMVDNLKY